MAPDLPVKESRVVQRSMATTASARVAYDHEVRARVIAGAFTKLIRA